MPWDDDTVAALFAKGSNGVLPAPMPLRDAIGLLVDAWAEANAWAKAEAEADEADMDLPTELSWHPPSAPRPFSSVGSEYVRSYHDGMKPPPPPPASERFGDEDDAPARK